MGTMKDKNGMDLTETEATNTEALKKPGSISCKDELDKGQKWHGPNRSRRY